MQLPLPAPGSTTDAVFTAYQKTVKGKLIENDVRTPMWVPQTDDSLFVAVLRSMLLLKQEEAAAFEVVVQRLKDAATRYGKTPLRLIWSVSKKVGSDASTPEIEDVRRLRAIVAAHVREHFVSYYKHHLSNYEEIWNAYGEGILGWEPYDPESGMDEEVHKEETARWKERVQKLIDFDSTSSYIKDGLGTALRYWTEGNDECAAKCLQVLRGFYEDVYHTRHEIRDALLIVIETPYQDAPTLVLDALADLLGVHIDLYRQEQDELGAAFSRNAKCVESYGPSRDDEEKLKELKAQYNKAGIRDFPLFDVLMMEYMQEEQRFYSYSSPDSMEVRLEERTPAMEQDNGDDDAVLQFYVALQNDEVLEDLPTFVDPCVEGAQEPGEAALVRAQSMDNSQELNDDDDDGDGDDNDDDDNDSDYEQPQGGGDGGDDDDDDDDDDDHNDDDNDNDNATQDETVPSVPIRLRPFANADYHMGMHEAPISVEQEAWAQDRIQKLHKHFLAHHSSRKGIGRIMLMQDPYGDPSMPTLAPTGGEAAESKETNRQNWDRLKASPLPHVAELTELIEQKLAIPLRKRISEERGEVYKTYQAERKAAEVDSDEWKGAVEWIELHAKDKRTQVGLGMALRLVVNENLPFAMNEEGGWAALLAWWKLLYDAADQAGDTRKGWRKDSEEGKWLCRTYYNIRSQDKWYKDAQTRIWQGLWEFLNVLYGWLLQTKNQPTLDAVKRLTGNAAFEESVSWASLGYRVDLGN